MFRNFLIFLALIALLSFILKKGNYKKMGQVLEEINNFFQMIIISKDLRLFLRYLGSKAIRNPRIYINAAYIYNIFKIIMVPVISLA